MGLLLLVILALYVPSCTDATTGKTGIVSPILRGLLADDGEGKHEYGFNELAQSATEERMNAQAMSIVDKLEPQVTGLAENLNPQIPGIAEKLKPQVVGVAENLEPKVAGTAEKLKPQVAGIAENLDPQVVEKLESELKDTAKVLSIDIKNIDPVYLDPALYHQKELASFPERVNMYPRMSEESMIKIFNIELERGTRFAKYGNVPKTTGTSLKMDVPLSESLSVAPTLASNIGRQNQVKDSLGRKSMSISVVIRSVEGREEVLLITSSKLDKVHWVLPKGSQEVGERIEETALREITEEAGVKGEVDSYLPKVIIKDADGPGAVWNPVIVNELKTYDVWAEDLRQRLWVPMDDAISMAEKFGRQEMVDVLKKAKEYRLNALGRDAT